MIVTLLGTALTSLINLSLISCSLDSVYVAIKTDLSGLLIAFLIKKVVFPEPAAAMIR